VYVQLLGRLGNQLFQYATARHLALLNGAQLRLDLGAYGKDTRDCYELGAYRILEAIAGRTESAALRGSRLCRLFHPEARAATQLTEPFFRFWPELLRCRAAIISLRGYWQSEKYFRDIRDQLLAEITLRRPLSDIAQELSKMMVEPNAVSVHVRRGDYVSAPSVRRVHPVLTLDYYQRAIRYLEHQGVQPRLFVFSDDIPWCRRNFKISGATSVVFVSEQVASAVEELELMRRCRHHVIANSSFSWWGAWLAQCADRFVVAPAKWFTTPERDVRDLLPDDWRRI
jgi:hypothetical protein